MQKGVFMLAIMARKLGMASVIDDQGSLLPLTLLAATPNTITQVKTLDKDGYNAFQIGFGQSKKCPKPQVRHFARAKVKPQACQEIRLKELPADLKVGDKLTTEIFSVGDKVSVTAKNKGKGFAGTIKRHNFHRQKKSHGGHGSVRRLGSIGSMFPQKVYKGRKMPGQMGGVKTTIRNLQVALVDHERQVIGVKGAVPGPRKGIVFIKKNES